MTATSQTSGLPATADASYPRLVADIGGTNARFGWLDGPGQTVARVHKLSVPAFAGPAEAARSYLDTLQAELGGAYRPPRHAAFAVATAVAGDRIAFTNSHWDFLRSQVQAGLGLRSLLMLNDFESLALSLPCLGEAQLRRPAEAAAAPPVLTDGSVLAVVGPGTGLGVGAVVRTPGGWVALPGEGGHATLAPADDLESAVLAQVRRQFAHVSAQRLVQGAAPAPLTAAQIVDAGNAIGEGNDALCSQTLDLFCALLGGFAGNVALTLGARGGVFIGGGIAPRFADRFLASAFRERFEAKGRFRGYLAAIPTALITDTLAALSGAALAIEQQVAHRA